MEGRRGDMADARMMGGRVAPHAGGVADANGFVRAIFPHFCAGCGTEGNTLCMACDADMDARMTGVFLCPICRLPSPFGAPCAGACRRSSAVDAIVSAGRYAAPALHALLRDYKYHGIMESGGALRQLFRRFLARHRALLQSSFGGAIVVPVPLHPIRLALRGFNQAEGFARDVAAAIGGRYSPRLLARGFSFRTQASFQGDTRRAKRAEGIVSVRRGAAISGTCVIVDDVFTTGATVQACAEALKRAGASSVSAMTVLRG